MKRSLLSAALTGALLMAPTPLLAQDYCITFPYPFTSKLIGKNFVVPKPNHCVDWSGWENIGGQLAASNGKACNDGTTLALTITTGQNEIIYTDVVSITLANGQGDDFPQGQETGTSFMAYPTAVTGGPCPATGNVMP